MGCIRVLIKGLFSALALSKILKVILKGEGSITAKVTFFVCKSNVLLTPPIDKKHLLT